MAALDQNMCCKGVRLTRQGRTQFDVGMGLAKLVRVRDTAVHTFTYCSSTAEIGLFCCIRFQSICCDVVVSPKFSVRVDQPVGLHARAPERRKIVQLAEVNCGRSHYLPKIPSCAQYRVGSSPDTPPPRFFCFLFFFWGGGVAR